MTLLKNTGGIAQTNCYMLADDVSKQAVLFDAPDGTVAPLLDQAVKRGWTVIGLWLTHGHFDHIADHALVNARFPDAKVLIHPLDELKLSNPIIQTARFPLPFKIPPRIPDGHLYDGQMLKIGSLDVRVIHTPGHAPGHVMFHVASEKTLVGGDLIICGSVGRTDLPDSEPEKLDASIRSIMTLPDDTRLLPGHCNITTLGDERRNNAYVRGCL